MLHSSIYSSTFRLLSNTKETGDFSLEIPAYIYFIVFKNLKHQLITSLLKFLIRIHKCLSKHFFHLQISGCGIKFLLLLNSKVRQNIIRKRNILFAELQDENWFK